MLLNNFNSLHNFEWNIFLQLKLDKTINLGLFALHIFDPESFCNKFSIYELRQLHMNKIKNILLFFFRAILMFIFQVPLPFLFHKMATKDPCRASSL